MNENQDSNNARPVNGDARHARRRAPAVLRPAYRARTQASIQAAFNAAGYSMMEVDEAEAISNDHVEMLRQTVDERRAMLEEIARESGADPERTVGFRVDGRFTPAALQRMGVFPASDSFREIDDMRGGGSLMGSATVGASNSIFDTWSGEHDGRLYQYVLDLQGIDVAGWVDGDGAESVPESGGRYDFDGMDEIHIGPVPVSRVGLLDSDDPAAQRLIAELVGANLHNAQRGVPLDTFVAYQHWSTTQDYAMARAGGQNPALQWTRAPTVPAIAEPEERDAYSAPMQRFLQETSTHDADRLAAAVAEIDRLRVPRAWNIQAGDLVPATVVRLATWPAQRGLVVYSERAGSFVRYDAQGNESRDAASLDLAHDVVLIQSQDRSGALHYDVGRALVGADAMRVERTVTVPADGDCLINALLHAEPGLAEGADPVQTLRHRLADFMLDDIDSYRHQFDVSGGALPSREKIDPAQVVEKLLSLCQPTDARRHSGRVSLVAQQLADLAGAAPRDRARVLFAPDVTLGLVRLARNEALFPPAGSSAHSNAGLLPAMVAQSLRDALPHASDAEVRRAIAGQETPTHASARQPRAASVLQELLPGRACQALQPLTQLIYGEIAGQRCPDLLELNVYDESKRSVFSGSPKKAPLKKALAKSPVFGSPATAQALRDRPGMPVDRDLQTLNAQIQRNVAPQQENAHRSYAAGIEATAQQRQREAQLQARHEKAVAASRAALGSLLSTNLLHEQRRQAQYADAREYSAQLRSQERDRREAERRAISARWSAQSSAFNIAACAASFQRTELRKSQRAAIRRSMSCSSAQPALLERSCPENAPSGAPPGSVVATPKAVSAAGASQPALTTLPAHAASLLPVEPVRVQQQVIYRADGTTESVSVVVQTPTAGNSGNRPPPQVQPAPVAAMAAVAPPSADGAGRLRDMGSLLREQARAQVANEVQLVQPMIRVAGANVPFGPLEVVNPPTRIPGPPNPWVPGPDVECYEARGPAQRAPALMPVRAGSSSVSVTSAGTPLGGSRQHTLEQRQATARQYQAQQYRESRATSGPMPARQAGVSSPTGMSARQQRINEAVAEVAGRRREASAGKTRGLTR
ncbi:hypothetical protein RZA67_15620 [Stenotrophomonas sp. C3(2023)]|uniref:hypothetical protein n=1 Tax=Stenotrophomonas sp. C3(2023) TaxID=3080277 RepID=UPI00293CC915|nr:hypothetical protein [Stenotrophomonas sp. C3(2023)]MDV3470152.1 hypothetical protein [Stenotrophomonas sp. C3(2023)]